MQKEKLKQILCCGENPTIGNVFQNDEEGYGILCSKKCGNGIFAVNRDVAIDNFVQHPNAVDNRHKTISAPKKENKKSVNNNNLPATNNRKELSMYFGDGEIRKSLLLVSSPILSSDMPLFNRYVKNNTERYPAKLAGPAWDKIWSTEVGRSSIRHEIESAFIQCVELGVTGDLVPMGNECILIPAIESYEFNLTHGNNAPFENINIRCVYEGDIVESGEKEGNYFFSITKEGDKETVEYVYVYGTLKKSGIVVGDKYSAKRLLEKAAAHSKPYANYIKMMKAYEYQKSEGNVIKDQNGRESFNYYTSAKSDDPYHDKSVAYFKQAESNGQLKSDSKGDYAVQSIPKKAGGTFDKKIYRYEVEGGSVATIVYLDELENPYAGADQPEMLRKSAGKSFLGKYAKVRNSEAAMNEVRSSKSAMKESVNLANEQFNDDVIDQ